MVKEVGATTRPCYIEICVIMRCVIKGTALYVASTISNSFLVDALCLRQQFFSQSECFLGLNQYKARSKEDKMLLNDTTTFHWCDSNTQPLRCESGHLLLHICYINIL